jgi:hypothetical protein
MDWEIKAVLWKMMQADGSQVPYRHDEAQFSIYVQACRLAALVLNIAYNITENNARC